MTIRQQPVHSRMCGIGERGTEIRFLNIYSIKILILRLFPVDRRPIDPPPVVQIVMNTSDDTSVER